MHKVCDMLVVSDLSVCEDSPRCVIGTHNGAFHCDEALACSLLRLTSQWKNSVILRTRDSDLLAQCGIIVDVGGIYNEEEMKFDHHQTSFSETFNDHHSILLSSAGLIFRRYGAEIITSMYSDLDANAVERIAQRTYDSFVQEVDAIDNGIEMCDGCAPRYRISTSLSSRVSALNPNWNDPPGAKDENACFVDAIQLVSKEFLERIKYLVEVWNPGREIVYRSLAESTSLDGEVVILQRRCPWRDHLFSVEKELGREGISKVVMWPQGNEWRVQCVPDSIGSFACRILFPPVWRGLRSTELSEKSRISECIFVHRSGFIGGNSTYDGALKMAEGAVLAARNEEV